MLPGSRDIQTIRPTRTLAPPTRPPTPPHLSLLRPSCGRAGCFTVNVGDVLSRWTDGELKSTYHRVRAPRPEDPNPYVRVFVHTVRLS